MYRTISLNNRRNSVSCTRTFDEKPNPCIMLDANPDPNPARETLQILKNIENLSFSINLRSQNNGPDPESSLQFSEKCPHALKTEQIDLFRNIFAAFSVIL